jgi:serine/threonine protein kinase
LGHPYICNIHEVSLTKEGHDFIVMEYAEGLSLQDKLADGPLPMKEALRIATEVSEALEKAHNAGTVHRDLKPSNIMLTAEGHAKVMDFGLAKKVVQEDGTEQDISSALTREGATLGTLAYMSPEQIKGDRVAHRSDIFAIQSDVARAIANALRAELSQEEDWILAREPTRKIEAYELVLQARHFRFTLRDSAQAVDCYQRAIEIDPEYAIAYVELADNWVLKAAWGLLPGQEQALLKEPAEALIEKAFELDPTLAEPHVSLGLLREHQFDWMVAEEAFRTAIDLNPGHWNAYFEYANLLTRLGRFDEALAAAKSAYDIDPLAQFSNVLLVHMHLTAGQSDEALEVARKMVELFPDWHRGWVALVYFLIDKGWLDRAFAVANDENDRRNRFRSPSSIAWLNGILGHLHALTGSEAEALNYFESLRELTEEHNFLGAMQMARIQMALGNKTEALTWLEESGIRIVGGPVKGIAHDPLWDPIRNDPNFQVLVEKLRLPEDAYPN